MVDYAKITDLTNAIVEEYEYTMDRIADASNKILELQAERRTAKTRRQRREIDSAIQIEHMRRQSLYARRDVLAYLREVAQV